MDKKISPCKGCSDRHEACWGTCEAYKEWSEKRIEEKRVITKAKRREGELNHTLYGYRKTASFQHLQKHRGYKT